MDPKANKHIKICIAVKKIIENAELKIYLATHLTGRAGKIYGSLEEQTGEEFWSLRMYSSKTPDERSRVKDPDIIAVKNDRIKYVVEVKWGFVSNYTNSTDLMSIFKETEMNEIKNMIDKSQVCRVIGPKVYGSTRVNQNKKFNFFRNEETKFLLVSDFTGLYNEQRSVFDEFQELFHTNYSDYDDKLLILNIDKDVGNIQPFANYLKSFLK